MLTIVAKTTSFPLLNQGQGELLQFSIISQRLFAFARGSAIQIYGINTGELLREVILPGQRIQCMLYSNDKFFCVCGQQDRSLVQVPCELKPLSTDQNVQTEQEDITPIVLYAFNSQHVAYTLEAPPSLQYFTGSQTIVLLRKFYSDTLVLCYSLIRQEMIYKFLINEECLATLDSEKLLVNYRQNITKANRLQIQIIDIFGKAKRNYAVPHSHPMIVLGVFLSSEPTADNEEPFELMISANSRYDGHKILKVSVSAQVQILQIYSFSQQWLSVLYINSTSIMAIEYEKEGDITRCYLTAYGLNEDGFVNYAKESINVAQRLFYDKPNRRIINYSTQFQIATGQSMEYNLRLQVFQIIPKNVHYCRMMNDWLPECSSAMKQLIYYLLVQ